MGKEVQIDLKEFYVAGIAKDDKGRYCLIRIAEDLDPERETEILKQMAMGKLEIRGHYYIPKKFSLGT